ncbi:restriction endonuclease subunit S [Aeromonas caviae]|uniref:restriction endonuclease subunit S n=1 Tax=Aeromonas caviae TaxID=648 RepID=UPI0029DA192D|nr:restriction endonuclease subunit S [Aeromonas caviae]MDX7728441.1 restriction endonuclease subunit S [Aeromonas caviae]
MSEVVTTRQQELAGKYRPYPEYKDSGVEWLGGIPNHWISVQSRRLFALRNTRARAGDRQLAATQKYGVIFQDIFMELEGRRVVQVQIGAEILKHVEPGDFVISMRSFQGGIEYCPYEGCVSSAYVPLTPIKWVHPDYFRYLFKSSPYIQALQSTSNLVRDGQALRFENFSLVDLPVVPIDEQRTIAAFLDYETARIDRLIAKQQRLIELLKEKRQAVISHTVIKGLNPNAVMKKSGIEWFGQVPVHWDASQLKYIVKLGTSITYGIVQAGPHIEDGIPYIKTSDMSGTKLPLDGYSKTSPEIDASYSRSKVYSGDLVIAIRATVGKCHIVPDAINGANLTQGTAKISPSEKITSEFLYLLIMSSPVQLYFDANAKGATFREITLEMLRRTPIVIPPLSEQKLICEYINKTVSIYDRLISKCEFKISLLVERRAALISAAVTGKIDLRGWTPPAEEAAA